MNKDWLLNIESYEKKIYSQGGQDGVIEYIFNNIRTKNNPPYCVEFGFNSDTLTGGSGPNVANLIKYKGWKGLLLDRDYENLEINLHKHFLTSDNICDIFKIHNVPKEPEYVSIDIDSIDLWLFEAILSDYRPLVVSVEYNSLFPFERAITVCNNNDFKKRKGMYGASLKALKLVGDKFGYDIINIVREDVFFIRHDLIEDVSAIPIEYFRNKTSVVSKTPILISKRGYKLADKLAKNSLDYEVYLKTGGDIKKSRQEAFLISRECLLKKK